MASLERTWEESEAEGGRQTPTTLPTAASSPAAEPTGSSLGISSSDAAAMTGASSWKAKRSVLVAEPSMHACHQRDARARDARQQGKDLGEANEERLKAGSIFHVTREVFLLEAVHPGRVLGHQYRGFGQHVTGGNRVPGANARRGARQAHGACDVTSCLLFLTSHFSCAVVSSGQTPCKRD